jgi:hypothetical protein
MNKIIIVHYEEDPAAIEAFKKQVAKLWSQHGDYTRQAIVSTIAGLEDADATVAKLMKNQEDIGAAVVPYYGAAAGAELTRLLKEHVTIAVDIFNAIKEARSTTALESVWLTNSQAIAKLLDSADSDHWPYEVVLGILNQHTDSALKQARSRFAKDWVADIAAVDESYDTTQALANAFATGILEKFPEQFVLKYSSKTVKK